MHSRTDDLLEFVVAYEDGGLSEAEIIVGFQKLVDSGLLACIPTFPWVIVWLR